MLSTCSKCGGHLFQLSEQSPAGSNYKLQFVQCSRCGVPIGAMEYYSSGAKLERLEKQVTQLGGQLENLEYTLNNIVNILRKR